MRTVATLALLAGFAGAQSPDEVAEGLAALFRAGQVGQLESLLTEDALAHLEENPAEALVLCRAAADAAETGVAVPDEWRRLADKLVGLGSRLAERSPDSAEALAVHAESLFCRARLFARSLDENRAEDWAKAAEIYVAVDRIDPQGGKALERAVVILREGMGAYGAETAKLEERALALAAEGAKRFPQSVFFQDIEHRGTRARIERMLSEDRAAGKRALEEYLDALRGRTMSPGSNRELAMTVYNDAVTFTKLQKGLGVRADYVMRTVQMGSRELEVQFPEGSRWKWEPGSLGTLYQYDVDGKLVRSFAFDTYRWDTNYFIDGKEFGGDNIKGLARLGEYDVEKLMAKVEKKRNLRRQRLNARVPHNQTVSIGGIDKDGDHVCWHLHYFKAKKTSMLTFHLSILEYGDFKEFDPAAEAVIDSIREP